jgi:uncharacterized protein
VAAGATIFQAGNAAMSGSLAIFVKTPGYSPVKTRLANSIGLKAATEWYNAACLAVKSMAKQMQSLTRISVYWAVAEETALRDGIWKDFPALAQGEGGLGERMGRVHRMLVRQHGFGILIGADAPQISADDLQKAAAFLHHTSARLVIGPASDGGFWCVGANRRIDMSIWTSVEYSQADTCEKFLAQLSDFECMTLCQLTDVDTEKDLLACQHELLTLENKTSAQENIVLLIKKLLSKAI